MSRSRSFPEIPIKTPAEQEAMRIAGRCASRVLTMIEPHVRAGVTTGELDAICRRFIEELGCVSATLGYDAGGSRPAFTGVICASVNDVVCHGIPGSRMLRNGDILNIDVTVIKDGWHGDTSRMYAVGEISGRARRLIDLTREALYLGINTVKPGATIGDIGQVIDAFARANRLSVVREYCGHGLGRRFHEEPAVMHFGKAGTGAVLKPGMCFTIEPMLNAGKAAVRDLRDGWTVVTRDGSLSAQWEHTVLVTENGCEILTVWE